MCLAIPAKVKSIKGRQAIVEYPDQTRPVLVDDPSVKAGDYVIVQMGIIIKKVSKKDAKSILQAWQETTKNS